MGVPLVGSTSEDIGDGEGPEVGETQDQPQTGVTNDSFPRPDSSSGFGGKLEGDWKR